MFSAHCAVELARMPGVSLGTTASDGATGQGLCDGRFGPMTPSIVPMRRSRETGFSR